MNTPFGYKTWNFKQPFVNHNSKATLHNKVKDETANRWGEWCEQGMAEAEQTDTGFDFFKFLKVLVRS